MGSRKRRSWSDEEKRSICHQTTAPGVSVAQVARRYAMNGNQILHQATLVRDQDGRSIQRIEISLADGHQVTVEGGFDGDALARLLKGLVS